MSCRWVVIAALLVSIVAARSEITVPSIFSDHMVLQRSSKVPVWGKGVPGESVKISLSTQAVKTAVGVDGKWHAFLNLADVAPGPFDLTMQGNNTIKISDVLIGQVWVAGGQSNMERNLANTNGGPEEVAHSANLLLRQFKVERNPQAEPAEDCVGAWTVASPESVGKFTAVGYYFGKELQAELQVPIGIINSTVGGTSSEAWTSALGLDKDPYLKEVRNRTWPAMKDYFAKKAAFVVAYRKWLKDSIREDKKPADVSSYAGEKVTPEGWTVVTLPILPMPNAKPPVPGAAVPSTSPAVVTNAPGVVWLRADVILSPTAVLEKLPITIGNLPGFESVYWNGAFVDELTPEAMTGPNAGREYNIPAALLKVGRNALAIRIFAPAGGVTIKDAPKPKQGAISEWSMKVETEFPALDPAGLAAVPVPPRQPSSPVGVAGFLFNGMINPIVPYGIKGILWYQGESNTKRAWQYRTSFPLLINDWREHWAQGDVPFYFVQLASYQPKLKDVAKSAESVWAETRDAQALALKNVPNTAMAVIIDTGEVADIHPRNKKVVGHRLAAIALTRDYGKTIAYSGPTLESSKVEGSSLVLSFADADGGLVAAPLPATYDEKSLVQKTIPLKRNSPNSQLEGFIICGPDKKWVWADAKIDGNSVVVSSDKVSQPVAVRYAWADFPTCNLTNASGIPASPFRTDDFPLTTVDNKFQ